MSVTLTQLLQALLTQGGSDLHVSTGTPPRFRVDGDLVPLQLPALTPEETKDICYSVLTEEQKKEFEINHELDFAFSVKGLARFRANIYLQKGTVSGAFRVIPYEIKSINDLGLPPVVPNLCSLNRGLVLVTGPTGSGKSTTIAAMINMINETRQNHIVTIEDPIEFVHPHKNCMVNQREVGADTGSFARALKSVLRQDPDVILVGEMRDLETISLALTAAETGHLVFATLHTSSCISTINRIIDVFPPSQQVQVRTQLSFALMGILSQTLLPTIGGGRVVALEILIPNDAIRNLIRENKIEQVYSQMQTGQEETGMQTFNQALVSLLDRRLIDRDTAFSKSPRRDELEEMLSKRMLSGKTGTNKTSPNVLGKKVS